MVKSHLPSNHSGLMIIAWWLTHFSIVFGTFQLALTYMTSSVLPKEPSQVWDRFIISISSLRKFEKLVKQLC